MRCHYDVLEVAQGADDAAVRSAYRRCALQWHPDKNQHRLEEADERFKEIQAAYDILSDKHERAWYDSHRDAILRSADRQYNGEWSRGQPPEDEVNLFQYFSSSCYSGYSEGPKGFYTVYSDLFGRLARQEAEAAGNSSASGASAQASFGESAADWPAVARFYTEWMSFSTCKDFSWGDQYHPPSAPHRKARRMMEEENRKRRRALRRDFNETVRELAAFVRRRDKRVAAHQAAEAERKLKHEHEQQARREQEKAERAARIREYREAEWLQQQESDTSAGSEDDSVRELEDKLYCVACEKFFKSGNALSNHERSKKHLEHVAALREALEQEEGEGDDDAEPAQIQHAGQEGAKEPKLQARDGRRTADAASDVSSVERSIDSPHDDNTAAPVPSSQASETSSLAEALAAAQMSKPADEGAASTSSEDSGDLDEDTMLERLISAHTSSVGHQSPGQTDSRKPSRLSTHVNGSSADAAVPDATVADNQSRATLYSKPSSSQNQPEQHGEEQAGCVVDNEEVDADPSLHKEQHRMKGKRGRRRAMRGNMPNPKETIKMVPSQQERVQEEQGKRKPRSEGLKAPGTLCHVCGLECQTRNQLFKHISATGHAELKI